MSQHGVIMVGMTPNRSMPERTFDTRDWQELMAWCRRKVAAARADPRSVNRFLDEGWPRRLARKAACCGDAELLDLFEEVLPLLRDVYPEHFKDCGASYFSRLREDLVTADLMVDLIAATPGISVASLVSEVAELGRKRAKTAIAMIEEVDRAHRLHEDQLYPGLHFNFVGSRIPAFPWEGAPRGREQREYAAQFNAAFLRDKPIPFAGETGYLYQMLEHLCGEDPTSYESAEIYRRVIRHFAGSPGERIGRQLLADHFLSRGQVEDGLAVGPDPFPEHLLQWSFERPELRLQISHLRAWGKQIQPLTTIGENYRREVEGSVQRRLERHHTERGINLLHSCYLDKNPYPEVKMEYPLFHRVSRIPRSVLLFGVQRDTDLFEETMRNWFRDAENEVRRAHGLPGIGEAWVSEAALFALIRDAFPGQEVQHQGRPSWLGRQSLDIYLPARKLAIEYQGIQHDMPVERFGGEEAFTRQQARDRRKRELCDANGVKLFEVRPGYDPERLLESIRFEIARHDD